MSSDHAHTRSQGSSSVLGAAQIGQDVLAALRSDRLSNSFVLDPTTTTTTTSAPAGTPAGPWAKVAVCEEGGRDDATFGYLGIYPETWAAYGGTQFSETAAGATWAEQVIVAYRIQSDPPDQGGCAGSW